MSTLHFSFQGECLTPTKFQGKSRQFSLTIDEPVSLGGSDIAANPVEYLLAGYAGCLNVVVNLIAKELNIVIESLRIHVEGDINPDRLLGISNKERAGFLGLQVTIDIQSEAPKSLIQVLLEKVKDRCPVNDNISNPTPIKYQVNYSVAV